MKIDICINTDDNYAKYCGTVIASVIANKAEDDEPVFHILHGGLNADNIEKLSKFEGVIFHKIEDELFKPFIRKAKLSWPTVTLYRLKAASILDLDKVIYLDCDLIVTSSLREYFEQDIEGYCLGAVPDVNYEAYMDAINIPKDKGYFYFNAGSLLMNLKQFRLDGVEEKLFDCMAKIFQVAQFADQDILNSVLYKNVKKLDKRYNYIPTFVDLQRPNDFEINKEASVIHYAGQKPWELAFRSGIRNEFWKHYKNSGFVSEKQFEKEHKKFMLGNSTIVQFLYLNKLYPFGWLRQSKQLLFKTVLAEK